VTATGDRLPTQANNVAARAVVEGQFDEDSSDEDAMATQRAPVVPHSYNTDPHDVEDEASFTLRRSRWCAKRRS
jgi:hypothetical protein